MPPPTAWRILNRKKESIKYAWARIKNRTLKDIKKVVKKQIEIITSLPIDTRFEWDKESKQFKEI